MLKKWNLQDIRPTNSLPTRLKSNRSQSSTPAVATNRLSNSKPRISEMHRPTSEKATKPKAPDEFNTLPDVMITNQKKTGRRYVVWAFIIFLVSIIGAFGIGNLTGGAEIIIYPKVKSMNINTTFTAYKERQAGTLTYEILTLEATGERQLTATGQEVVAMQTEGELVIYKTTPGSEKLIKNTRFESPDGKIFRIQESVTIPGATKNEANDIVPGFTKIKVFADQAGAEYNLPANTKFTIPGFMENGLSELFNSVYAVNPTGFTGGFDGPRYIMDEAELETATISLQKELLTTLEEKVINERPANYIILPNSSTITYSSLPATQHSESLVTIKEQAVLRVPLFLSSDFASLIAEEIIVGYDTSEKVRIDNIDSLNFSYLEPVNQTTNIADLEAFEFKIIGQPITVWTYDGEELKNSLAGKEKTALPLALGQYSQASHSTLKIKPFWKNSFPADPNKITITEILETI